MQIEGRNPVIELLRSKVWIKKVIVQSGINVDEKINEILKRASNRQVFIQRKDKKYLDRISQTANHQGVIAVADFEYSKLLEVIESNIEKKSANKLIYIREALHDDNIGAIARSAEAAGFTGIIIPPKADISPQAFRVSMGALANIKVIRENLFNAIKTCQKNLIRSVAIERDGNDTHYEVDLTGEIMLIIGGEDKSLSQEVIDKADICVNIPMQGKINSLNMSAAAAVVIFEKLRQDAIISE
ncbi:MAG: TrmH family RNA methyltransferase [Candidatus Dojkabacteria bacterium]